MDTTSNWVPLAEAAIRSLRDIDGVRIQTEDDAIVAIHVVCRSNRPPKQIVRDIQTLLLTKFERTIDHRIVSVAFTRLDAPPEGNAAPPEANATPGDSDAAAAAKRAANGVVNSPQRRSEPAEPPSAGPGPSVSPAGRASSAPSRPERAPAPAEPAKGLAERIRFGSVNLHVSGHRARADVELLWMGIPRTGSATGWGTRDRALELIAQATLATVQDFLDERMALSLEAVEVTRAGRGDVVVVALELLAHRTQKTLAGCCPVGEDVQEAVVLATLSALNRIVGGLPTREPTEYVLRPTSS